MIDKIVVGWWHQWWISGGFNGGVWDRVVVVYVGCWLLGAPDLFWMCPHNGGDPLGCNKANWCCSDVASVSTLALGFWIWTLSLGLC